MSDLSRVTAVILAGGLGTRLQKIVSDQPKVMAEINCKPFIAYLLDRLVEVDIERIIISTGYMSTQIEKRIGASYKDVSIVYSKEENPLGTGGALKLAGQVVDMEYCLVMNGDSYTELDPVSLFISHKQKNAIITLLVKEIDNTTRFGIIQINEQNEIIKFMEKGSSKGSGLINAGVYIMNTSTIQKIPEKTPYSLEYDFFPSKIGQGIYGYKTKGRFIDIGTPESYAKAEAFFEQKPVSA